MFVMQRKLSSKEHAKYHVSGNPTIGCSLQSTLALGTPRYYGHPLLRTKSSPPPGESYRGLTENYSCYCGFSLLWTPNYVPRVSAITRVDCSFEPFPNDNWDISHCREWKYWYTLGIFIFAYFMNWLEKEDWNNSWLSLWWVPAKQQRSSVHQMFKSRHSKLQVNVI